VCVISLTRPARPPSCHRTIQLSGCSTVQAKLLRRNGTLPLRENMTRPDRYYRPDYHHCNQPAGLQADHGRTRRHS
jgi:hypothetical protein